MRIVCIIGSLAISLTLSAQQFLSLEGCRQMALQDNKQAQIDRENIQAAKYMRQAATANFFPKFSANGAYLYNTTEGHILPKQVELDNGTTLSAEGFSGLPSSWTWTQSKIGGIYSDLYKSLTLDFHNVFLTQVGFVQPIYVGGKVINSFKMAQSYEKIEQIKGQKNNAQLLVDVEEAYWRVLSVNEKLKLATQYVNLLRTLQQNVEAAYEEGVATQADILKVRVKLNEAESSLAKAQDGLTLSKMALCQIVGLPLDADIMLDEKGLDDAVLETDEVAMDEILANREEMQMLTEAKKMAKAGVGLAGSFLQPNIVASANYIAMNPNIYDGFQNKFHGFFSVGVVMNVPIAHANDILNYKAAKHKAKTVELKMEEASEKIQLQATQDKHKVVEANNSLIRAKANIKSAEENLRFAREAYDAGVATASDVMMAQTAWEKAYSEKIDAAVALRMAELTFRQHTGTIGK